MPPIERGRSLSGFRVQLLARLQNEARRINVSVQRLQKRVAFERFLARLNESNGWVLKGGFALELRYEWRSRPTVDLDLRAALERHEALALLREAVGRQNSSDNFEFRLGDIEQELQGAPGGTSRVRVIASVAGKQLTTFSIDLSSGDALEGEPDILEGSDLLGFAGVKPLRFPVYPVTQHLAEKLHAYTLPRDAENTRVKDLVDMVILAGMEEVDGSKLAASTAATFATRGSHPLPSVLPQPPPSSAGPYRRLASEAPLAPNTELDRGHALAAEFWNPVLSDQVRGERWNPLESVWKARSDSE
jgi:hypothetical protein